MTVKQKYFMLLIGSIIVCSLAVLIMILLNQNSFANPKEILVFSLVFYLGITAISMICFFNIGILLIFPIATVLICLLVGNFFMSMIFHINVGDIFAFLKIYKEYGSNFLLLDKLLYFGAYLSTVAIALPLLMHLIEYLLSKNNQV